VRYIVVSMQRVTVVVMNEQFNSIKMHGINNVKIQTWKFRRLMKFEIKENSLMYLDTVKV
jgi:hypothetical protein